jgi:YidC/Oxa1 family membrane protein insertase
VSPWDLFKDGIFAVINWFYSWCGDWGLAIILITILFRILIYPITRKQFKSSYKMQKLQPKMKAIREKYQGDPQRQQQETAKLYQEAKFNPLSGCLPMLLQMPIFIALYQVLLELQTRAGEGTVVTFLGVIENLTLSPAAVYSEGGIIKVIPYVVLVLLFGVSMLIPMLVNKQTDKQTRVMMGVMSLVMIFFGWSAPAGVLLYWDASSLIGVGQQIGSRYFLEKKDERIAASTIDITPIKVEVDRKERKARPRKKG